MDHRTPRLLRRSRRLERIQARSHPDGLARGIPRAPGLIDSGYEDSPPSRRQRGNSPQAQFHSANQPAVVPLPRVLIKWFALWAPVQWPQGFKTAPEIDQQGGGTRPVEFAADMKDLRTLIERFTRRPADFVPKPHTHFGSLSEREWNRLAYLHADHHLRQFGA